MIQYAIAGTPSSYTYAERPKMANYTSYPEWAYRGYYRANPWVDEKMPKNGGPYLPDMYPYGQGGRPKVWQDAKSNSAYPGAVTKTPDEIRRSDVILSKKGSGPYMLWKVSGVRKLAKRTDISVKQIGTWRPGLPGYMQAPIEHQTILEFTGPQRHTTPLSVLAESIRPVTLAEPQRKGRKSKRNAAYANRLLAVPSKLAKAGRGSSRDYPKVIRSLKQHYPQYAWDAYLGRSYTNSSVRESLRSHRLTSAVSAPWVRYSRTSDGERFSGMASKPKTGEAIRGDDVRFAGKRLKVGESVFIEWGEDMDITFKRTDPYGRSAFANRGRPLRAARKSGMIRKTGKQLQALARKGSTDAKRELARRARKR